MIYVDTNVFLRYLIQPSTSQDVTMAAQATELFEQAEAGTTVLTTSEAILAEVVFILSDHRHYGTARPTVVAGLRPILEMRAFRLPTKAICLQALDIWEANPKLSYPDALGGAYSELRHLDLATFDKRLRELSGLSLHAWSANGTTSDPT